MKVNTVVRLQILLFRFHYSKLWASSDCVFLQISATCMSIIFLLADSERRNSASSGETAINSYPIPFLCRISEEL